MTLTLRPLSRDATDVAHGDGRTVDHRSDLPRLRRAGSRLTERGESDENRVKEVSLSHFRWLLNLMDGRTREGSLTALPWPAIS